jgi:DNA end-binding protein Ku
MKAIAKVNMGISLLKVVDLNLYSAIESSEKIKLHQLHCKCHNRIEYKYFCPVCNKDILDKKAEIIKGFEESKDSYVLLEEGEIESCKKESTGEIKVISFVNDGEIPEIFYSKANFLAPAKKTGDGNTFGLVYEILNELKKTALAKLVLRQKDHFFAIKPYNGILIAYDLHFPNEIRDTKELGDYEETNGFDADTRELAKQLILKLSRPFNPDEIQDEYTEGLKEIIEAKSKGEVIKPAEVKAEKKVVNLQEALKESLKMAVNF